MHRTHHYFKLNGKIQHYQWGGYRFIPQLLKKDNSEGKPYAEYWLGAHESAPAELEGATPSQLHEYITANKHVLGKKTAARFKRLPYLLKVLDIREMLSIQVHPTKKAAEEGFEAENKAGIPLNASHRNYKDDNHKPELMVALGDFWLLHGFKSPNAIQQTFTRTSELHFLQPIFEKGNYHEVYKVVMTMSQNEVNQHLQPLLDRIIPLYNESKLNKNNPDFWAARAALSFNKDANIDRGIFSIYLLNLVHLKKGEAIFQDAGILHAYLEGQNIEIMANSDNVLRGGLTPKHIDVPELLKHVRFEEVTPHIIKAQRKNECETVYDAPVDDFRLSHIHLVDSSMYLPAPITTEIFFVLKGKINVRHGEESMKLNRGEAFVTFEGCEVLISAVGEAEVIRASVGD